MTNPIVDPLIGRTVAHYDILARLGGGGMGVVYKARDTRLGRVVALKFLPQQWSHDEDAKQRFIREAQAASATDHRNICTIHDIGTADDGQLFIVMAYYEGVTLKQRLDASGALPIDEALDIATQVAEGLARAHAQGVVHRDIKPGNLILAEDGVRILDFGLATFANALQLTIVGSTLGTAAYMSPEQVRGEAAGPASDVWAVGAILYQMLAGHVPFQGAYAEAIAYAIKHETPAPLRDKRPEIPEEVEQLVFRALHKDASVRYATGRELARALRQVRGQTVPMDLRTEAVDAPQRLAQVAAVPARTRLRRPFAVVAATVVVALLAGAGWVLWPVPRVPVVVVPVANQTGHADLDPFVPALTFALVRQLEGAPEVRAAMWWRSQEVLRGAAAMSAGLSSNQVVQTLREAIPGHALIRPAIVSEGRNWFVRVEILDAVKPLTLATLTTPPVTASVLRKELAHRLMADTAAVVQQYFSRRWIPGAAAATAAPTSLATLDATQALVDGIDAFDNQEYLASYRAFERAAAQDNRSPVVQMWLARAAQAMRKEDLTRDAARRAVALLDAAGAPSDRLLVESLSAEINGNRAVAEERLRQLIDLFRDDSRWAMELAVFQARHAQSKEAWNAAISTFHEVLAGDAGVVRAHLELCRAYNQIQETQNAVAEGQRALESARTVGWRGAEAQSRLCVAEALRQGQDQQRRQAQDYAKEALAAFEALQFTYNVPRALFYLGVAAFERGLFKESIDYWRRAEAAIEAGGNDILTPVVFANLGVAYEALGQVDVAFEYARKSAAIYERLGDERRAARQQKNLATMKVRYGENPDEGLRDALTVLEVVRARGDVEFEILTLALIGDYYRIAGRYRESAIELNKALQLAKQQTLSNRIASTSVALARLAIDEARYAEANERLAAIVGAETPQTAPEAWIALGRTQTRMGDFAGARKTLTRVVAEMPDRESQALRPFLHLTMGELAFDSNHLAEARQQFTSAASYWRQPFNVDAAVEATAYLGLIEGLDGRPAAGRAKVESSLEAARAMGRAAIEMRCRTFMAQLYLLERRPADALRLLATVTDEMIDAAGQELRAQVLHWRAQARQQSGDSSKNDAAAAQRLIEELRTSIPPALHAAFNARRTLRGIAS